MRNASEKQLAFLQPCVLEGLANRRAECIVAPYTFMIIRVDPDDPRPLYRQVADEIKTLIASGELYKGDPLPPVRRVAADLGVNLNTIASAYRELRREGLITIRHGARAVVASSTSNENAKRELRKSIRGALTKMLLAGMPRAEIKMLVSEELRELTKGSRG
jgi:GntR family transcriptional regulator